MSTHRTHAGLTRRALLARGATIGAGASGLGGLLAACGGSSPSSSQGASSGGSGNGGKITFYSWQGFEPGWKQMKQWRATRRIGMSTSFANSNSDIVSKFTTGGGKGTFNLSAIEIAWMPYLQELGVLQPIDMSRLPNYAKGANLFPIFKQGQVFSQFLNFGGHQYGLPLDWGYAATNYDASKVPAPKTLMDLTKPPYRGKFVVSQDSQGMVFQAAFSLGFKDLNGHYTRDQFNQILARLKEVFAAARRVNVGPGDIGNLYQNGDIVASLTTWPGMPVFVPGAKSKDIKSVLLDEGALGYIDAYFIPADAPQVDSVYAVLNEFMTPRQQAGFGDYLDTNVTDRRAWPMLGAAIRENYPRDPGPIFAKAPVVGLPIKPPAGIVPLTEWLTAWEHLQNS